MRSSRDANSRIEVAIVADDLTGAADCAAAFAATGRAPLVLLEPCGNRPRSAAGAEVIAVSANSRDIGAEAAGEAIAIAVRELSAARPQIWFKKIDSTLRGHLGPELSVVSELLHPELTIVCPAFPRTGRVMRDGRVYANGQPLEQTQLWQAAGGGPGHLPSMLTGSVAPLVSVGLADLRDRRLARELRGAAAGTAMVVDAETDEDLETLIAAGLECGRDVLWVGSAGLAAALASALQASAIDAAEGAFPSPDASAVSPTDGPVLIVAGSGAVQTRRQLADLQSSCDAEVATLSADALLDREPDLQRVIRELVERALAGRRDLVVTIEPERASSRSRDEAVLSDLLGELVGEWASGFDGLVLTGGDTARAVLQAMGVVGLIVLGSVEDGIPLSRATPTGHLIVTKAGAFGDDCSLTRAVQLLHGVKVEMTTMPRDEL